MAEFTVAAHQPNFLPGVSVISKIAAADMVLWLDEVQFTKNGWTNRNQMPDGSWLTVPVERSTDGLPMNRVRIAQRHWYPKAERTLRQHYRNADWLPHVERILERPYRTLIGLNLALLRLILDRAGGPEWVFQSHLDGGRSVLAVSDNPAELIPISERLAMMVAEVGGTVYLSGPSGRNYLDETPFHQRGIRVDYYRHDGPNQCALSLLPDRQLLAA